MTNLVDIEQIKSLIKQGESHTLEFKKSTAQLKPAFETVCAFLNNKGGTVLIGVSDNGDLQSLWQSSTTEWKFGIMESYPLI